jgi:hypothetical protein
VGAAAQAQGSLPQAPDYRGEIRRGPDGRLVAVPEPPVIETAPGETAPGHPSMPAQRAAVQAAPKPAALVVGPGERIATISEAARQARDGDVIEIKSGEYRGQPAVWTQRDITIRGVGKRPVMVADNRLAEDKGIWVVRGDRVRIENIEFRGARVADMNGAGIRFDRGSLTVVRCGFFDNEMGILTANSPDLSLQVFDSEFADAPRTTNDFHHLIYVGRIGKFVLRGSRFRNGFYGHLVKSRARENHLLYNAIFDGAHGHASYEVDLPNGGLVYMIGNVVGQGPETENPAVIAYGSEGLHWSQNAIYLAHNTVINDAPNGNFLAIRGNRGPDAVEVWALNNLVVGPGDFQRPAQGRFEGNRSVGRRDRVRRTPGPPGQPVAATRFGSAAGQRRDGRPAAECRIHRSGWHAQHPHEQFAVSRSLPVDSGQSASLLPNPEGHWQRAGAAKKNDPRRGRLSSQGYGDQADLRRRRAVMPERPAPSRARVPGSGTELPCPPPWPQLPPSLATFDT